MTTDEQQLFQEELALYLGQYGYPNVGGFAWDDEEDIVTFTVDAGWDSFTFVRPAHTNERQVAGLAAIIAAELDTARAES